MPKSNLYYYTGAQPSALLQAFRDAAKDYPRIAFKPYATKSKAYEPDRVLTVLLSDLHFGTDLSVDQHLQAYSNTEEARRLAHVLKNVIDYKVDKRDQTALDIAINGDLFAGLLGHDDRAAAELTVQMMRSSHLLTQFIAHCCTHFARVTVRVQWGNHGRNLLRHQGRADNAKWENFELLVVMMVHGQLAGTPNLRWDIPKRPISFWRVFGHQFGMTHGDTVLGKKPGTSGLEAALAGVKASKFYKLKGELDVLFLGHWHQGQMQVLGDTTVFCNPALIPPDGFSETSGYLNACGQWLVETTPKYAVGDVRLVRVDADVDADARYDSLISPWTQDLVFVTEGESK